MHPSYLPSGTYSRLTKHKNNVVYMCYHLTKILNVIVFLMSPGVRKGYWHVPIASQLEYEEERTWLCIRRVNLPMANQDSASAFYKKYKCLSIRFQFFYFVVCAILCERIVGDSLICGLIFFYRRISGLRNMSCSIKVSLCLMNVGKLNKLYPWSGS